MNHINQHTTTTRLLVLEPDHPGAYQLTRLMTNVAKLLVNDWARSGGGSLRVDGGLGRRVQSADDDDDDGSQMVVRTCLTVLNVAMELVASLEPGASPRLLDVATDTQLLWTHPQKKHAKQLWMVAAAGE
jgi:hypothetical protein